MRVLGVIVLVAAVLAASAPLAAAQGTADLPPSLFEPAPEQVVGGARDTEEGGKASFLLAVALLSAAAAGGYAAGSARSTRRS
jgi:hypothetical protein